MCWRTCAHKASSIRVFSSIRGYFVKGTHSIVAALASRVSHSGHASIVGGSHVPAYLFYSIFTASHTHNIVRHIAGRWRRRLSSFDFRTERTELATELFKPSRDMPAARLIDVSLRAANLNHICARPLRSCIPSCARRMAIKCVLTNVCV